MISLLIALLAITFHPVTILEFPTTTHTHVRVCGVVKLVKHEADGDTHIRLTDGKHNLNFIVAEIIPSIPLLAPKLNQDICVEGISREDKLHRWFEVHPVLHWSAK